MIFTKSIICYFVCGLKSELHVFSCKQLTIINSTNEMPKMNVENEALQRSVFEQIKKFEPLTKILQSSLLLSSLKVVISSMNTLSNM